MTRILPKIIALGKPAIPDAFGLANSPIGYFLAAWQGELLVRLTLLSAHAEKDMQAIMEDYDLPAFIKQDDNRAKALIQSQLFNKHEWRSQPVAELKIGFHGTNFQYKAMQQMMKIPSGKTLSYGQLAVKAGATNAARAIGSICSKNPVAFIVPCHRVTAANGLGGYGHGSALKRQLLDWEKRA